MRPTTFSYLKPFRSYNPKKTSTVEYAYNETQGTSQFLDASSHLYKSVSVRPSVSLSVRPSVRNAFVKIAENGVMQDGDASYVV